MITILIYYDEVYLSVFLSVTKNDQADTIKDDHGGNGGDLDLDVADFDNETPGEPKKM